MLTLHKINTKPYNNTFFLDDRELLDLSFFDGNEFRVDCDQDIWVSTNETDTDIKILSTGQSRYELPRLSSFLDLKRGGEHGQLFSDTGYLNLDLAKALMSDIAGRKLEANRDQQDNKIGVVVDGVVLKQDVDFSFDQNFLDFKNPPAKNKDIRIKWQLVNFAENNGSQSVVVSIPKFHNEFRSFYIHTSNYDLTPIKIFLKQEPANQHSDHVAARLPEAISDKYPVFQKFIEDYFDLMGSSQSVFDFMNNLDRYRDVDLTIDAFLNRIKFERLNVIPDTKLKDEKILIKKILDFYQIRGTEKSYKFLMRILYNTACDVFYPSERIFRASDSEWNEDYSLKVISIKQSFSLFPSLKGGIYNFFSNEVYKTDQDFGDHELLKNLEGAAILGTESKASATVEKVSQSVINGVVVTDLTLSSVNGFFKPYEIFAPLGLNFNELDNDHKSNFFYHGIVGTQVVDAKPLKKLNKIDEQYNDKVLINSSTGNNAHIIPKTISDETTHFRIDDGGFNYRESDQATFKDLPCELVIGAERLLDGQWSKNTSVTSDDFIRLQDSHFFQMYSYVIRSDLSEIDYKNKIKSITHPAGFKMFSSTYRGSTIVNGDKSKDSFQYDIKDLNYYMGEKLVKSVDMFVDGRKSTSFKINNYQKFVNLDGTIKNVGEFQSSPFTQTTNAYNTRSFVNAIQNPIVVASMTNTHYQTEKNDFFSRIRNITTNGFEFFLDEYLPAVLTNNEKFLVTESGKNVTKEGVVDGVRNTEVLSYLAIEKGLSFVDGKKYLAGETTINSLNKIRVNYSDNFNQKPVVMANIIDSDKNLFVLISDVDRLGFTVQLKGDEVNNVKLHWIATEPVNKESYEIGLVASTSDFSVTHNNDFLSPPLLFSQTNNNYNASYPFVSSFDKDNFTIKNSVYETFGYYVSDHKILVDDSSNSTIKTREYSTLETNMAGDKILIIDQKRPKIDNQIIISTI